MLKNRWCRAFYIVLLALCLVGCKNNNKTQEGSTAKKNETSTNQDVSSDDSDRPETDGGGNKNNNENDTKVTVINVLISEDKYYYENETKDLKDLINIVGKYNGEVIVHIVDSNATENAYSELVNELKKMEVSYEVEK